MEATSAVSSQSNLGNSDKMDAQWNEQLNDVDNKQTNGWRTENNATSSDGDIIIDKNGQFKPEVQKILDKFVGNMAIEMTKTQSPAKKISMDGNDE